MITVPLGHCTNCGIWHGHSGRRCAPCKAADMQLGAILCGLLAHDKSQPEAIRKAASDAAARLGVHPAP